MDQSKAKLNDLQWVWKLKKCMFFGYKFDSFKNSFLTALTRDHAFTR